MSLVSYDIDFDKWISDNLHPERRKPKRIALLKALAKRIRDIHAEFVSVQSEESDKAQWAGLTILLERLLQLKFGSGIVIVNVGSSSAVQIEFEADNISNPVTLEAAAFTNPINGEAGEGVLGSSFVVQVPAATVFNQDEMKAVINKYLIHYKTYTIELI